MPLLSLSDLNFTLPSLSFNKPSLDPATELPTVKEQEAWIKWTKDSNNEKETVSVGQTGITAENDVYYRWQDDNGVWQITELPNPAKENIVVHVDPEANIIQSLSKASQGNDQPVDKDSKDISLEFPTTAPVTEIPKMIEDVKKLQEVADQRQEVMDSRL